MRRIGDDGGGVLVIVALCLPVFVVFITLVVDVGNWFVHKRHLQMQADAGALAGGGLFTVPVLRRPDPRRDAQVRRRPGERRPVQPPGRADRPGERPRPRQLRSLLERGRHGLQRRRPSCAARMVDVKITEASLPWFFGLNVVPAINAHARVMIQALRQARGALPVAVPDVDPRSARAYFVDEALGALLASTPLTRAGTSNGLAVWDNAAAPVSVPIDSSRIGVRIALGGGSSSTCGEYLVECYDLASGNGIVFVRGYSATGSAAQPNPPIARDVRLFAASCPDGYFHDSSASCSIGVSAAVDFGVADPAAVGGKVSAVVAGTELPLSYDATSGRWVSTTYFGVAPGAGPVGVELKWEETSGTVSGNNCTTTGGNRCKGTFGVVQRTFSATVDRSGPVKQVEIYEGGVPGANSFATGTTHDLVVRVAIAGNLEVAQSVSDPLVELRVTGGSQNQSIDCDPNLPNLRDEIEQGCAPLYAINEGAPCPSTAPTLWASPQPWDCVAVPDRRRRRPAGAGHARSHPGRRQLLHEPEQLGELPQHPA